MKMLRAIQSGDLETAQLIRQAFFPLEDLRNKINPIRVLHRAVELAEIANTGPMLPMLGELPADCISTIAQAATLLRNL